jgi:hypothetical protein
MIEQLHPFPAECVLEHEKTGGVSARPRQAFDKTYGDWVDHVDENDRDSPGCLLRSRQRQAATRDYHVRRQGDQFGRVFAYVICIARAPTVINSQVATDRPAQFVQALCECR